MPSPTTVGKVLFHTFDYDLNRRQLGIGKGYYDDDHTIILSTPPEDRYTLSTNTLPIMLNGLITGDPVNHLWQ